MKSPVPTDSASPVGEELGREHKYVSLAREFESRILSGDYRVGERLPSERTLAASTGMTVMTVRQALGVLAEKGLISRQQGRGTFVTLPDSSQSDAKVGTIFVLGLGSNYGGLRHPVNWQVRMLRFRGIVDAAFRSGLTLQTEPELNLDAPPRQLIGVLRQSGGLILHEELLPESVLMGLHQLGMPIVAINCYHGLACCSRIEVDSREGALLAMQHLQNLGHERVGLIMGDPRKRSMRDRMAGCVDALAIADMLVDDDLILQEPRGLIEDGEAAARKLLALPNPPTAIFAASDNRALGVLQAAKDLGIDVPGKLAVVGCDDIHEASTSTPALSTVHNPLYETGAEAIRLLYNQITRRDFSPEVRVVPMKLVVRDSCGADAEPDS
jgi:DNA-binding LacI/PurR family transcriptional regulator